jgi:hypothetical protein
MAIVRLLIPFLALTASAVAGAQPPARPQAAPRTGRAQLPPGSGTWADSGLVVAEGDRLSFQVRSPAQPAESASGRFEVAPPRPTFRARIGDREFPISAGSPVEAPVAGLLQLEVQYPQFPQVPPSRWPRVVMTVTDDPRPSKAGPGAPTNNEQRGTDETPAGNQVAGVSTGNRRRGLSQKPAHHQAPIPGWHGIVSAPFPRSANWMLLALAAAGVAAVLAAALALGRAAKAPTPGPGAPAVTIDPALDTAEGGFAGDAIEPDGPEVRLRGALEPGETPFAQGEPALIGEARNG